jgi:hypothetical protein
MPVYIVCRKKRNNPRMDVRVCQLKCTDKEECREFNACGKSDLSEPSAAPSEPDSVGLEAA